MRTDGKFELGNEIREIDPLFYEHLSGAQKSNFFQWRGRGDRG